MTSNCPKVTVFRISAQKGEKEAIDMSTAVSIAINRLKQIGKLVFTYPIGGKGISFTDEVQNTYSVLDSGSFEKALLDSVAQEALTTSISTKDRRMDLYIMPGIATKTIRLC